MSGGQSGGILSNSTTGVSSVVSTATGVAVLPNTGGNVLLTVLSIATIVAGLLIAVSFFATRIVARNSAK